LVTSLSIESDQDLYDFRLIVILFVIQNLYKRKMSLICCCQGIYLYIGITSLCLYNTAGNPKNQDGILYKSNNFILFKMINLCSLTKSRLTFPTGYGMMNMMGRSNDRPISFEDAVLIYSLSHRQTVMSS